MTTTAQALDRFHQMLLKLQEIRSASVASAAPNALESSISLLYLSVVKLPNELTSPHSTWQKLLQEKVNIVGLCVHSMASSITYLQTLPSVC